jgi:hypothetical protein
MAPRNVAVRERASLHLIQRRGDPTKSHDYRTRCLNSGPGLLRRVSYYRSDVNCEPLDHDHWCEHLDDCPIHDLDGADNRIDHRQRFWRYV